MYSPARLDKAVEGRAFYAISKSYYRSCGLFDAYYRTDHPVLL